MRRLAVLLVLLAALAAGCFASASAAAAAKPSWAQPQIKAVVAAGLLADSVAAFRPAEPLTQQALADALAVLGAERETRFRYALTAPGRAVTIRELDAALVGFAGLGDAARAVTAQLRAAGLAPKPGAGTETVARLLGLRLNHPAEDDALEAGLNDLASRAEAAYSLARMLKLSEWDVSWIREQTAVLAVPELTDWQRQILRRAVSFVGYPYVWGGTSERGQQLFGKSVPGGFDCSGFVWRVFKLEPFEGASALAAVLRGRTTFQMSGEVPVTQRILTPASLQPGDLLFQGARGPKSKPAEVDHAAIYLGGGWFVHSSGSGVTLHPFAGWYSERFAWARRPLREAGLV